MSTLNFLDDHVCCPVHCTLFVFLEIIFNPVAHLEVDDAMTAGSRTPNTTPPERRRENVSELSDVLEALQLVGRRNTQPVSIYVHSLRLEEHIS